MALNNTEHWCGASIIDPHWIITAGHCVDVYAPVAVGERVLRLAEHDRMILEGYEKYVVPDRIYLHPGFVIGGEFSPGYYDVALMHLKERLVFTDRIQPVCLPSDEDWFEAGKMCSISGWGKTSAGPNGTYAKVLQQLQVTIKLTPSFFPSNMENLRLGSPCHCRAICMKTYGIWCRVRAFP